MTSNFTGEEKAKIRRKFKEQVEFNQALSEISEIEFVEPAVSNHKTSSSSDVNVLLLLFTLCVLGFILFLFLNRDIPDTKDNYVIDGAALAAPAPLAEPAPLDTSETKDLGLNEGESYSTIKGNRSPEERVADAWKEALEANAEVDAAQDAVLNEYKSKAVEHYVANGAGGVKVDTFILKNGRTVSCTTIIGNYGKSIDCN